MWHKMTDSVQFPSIIAMQKPALILYAVDI